MEKSTMSFNFQEIPLDEAVNAVIAGDGNYAEIKSALLAKLPKLESGKAFAFGLPQGKEVPEDQRRGLCMAVNTTLKKAKILWKVTYSGTKKLFICVPISTPATYRTKNTPPESNDNLTELQKLRAAIRTGLSIRAASAKCGISKFRTNYLLYEFSKRNPPLSVSLQAKKTDYERKKSDIMKLAETGLKLPLIAEKLGLNLNATKAIYYRTLKKRSANELQLNGGK